MRFMAISYWQICSVRVGTQIVSCCPLCLVWVSWWPSTVTVWQFFAGPCGVPVAPGARLGVAVDGEGPVAGPPGRGGTGAPGDGGT